MIIGIVCVDRNFGIGKKNDLLFHLKKDMQFFRQTTADSIVVCGYNTLLSFPGGKPLKGRSTICLCPEEVERDDCFCIHDFDEMVRLVKELAKNHPVFIIGGARLYKSMLPYYEEVLVTKVDADGEAEVFFPNLDENADFESKPVGGPIQDGDYTIQFWTYKRKKDIN
jgi:dihydrofolate reductase